MNLRAILRRFVRRRPHLMADLLISGHSHPAAEGEVFAGSVPASVLPHTDPGCGPWVSDEDGAAFIAGEQAALVVVVPLEDCGHERAFWLGFLSALRRRGSVSDALRHAVGFEIVRVGR